MSTHEKEVLYCTKQNIKESVDKIQKSLDIIKSINPDLIGK